MTIQIEPRITDPHEYYSAFEAHFALGLPNPKAAPNHGMLLRELAAITAAETAQRELKLRLLDALGDEVSAYNMMSWDVIGSALGVSAQAASQMHKRRKAGGRA